MRASKEKREMKHRDQGAAGYEKRCDADQFCDGEKHEI